MFKYLPFCAIIAVVVATLFYLKECSSRSDENKTKLVNDTMMVALLTLTVCFMISLLMFCDNPLDNPSGDAATPFETGKNVSVGGTSLVMRNVHRGPVPF